ncbi:MAG: winged helix-turn-helix domain-containing protein [Chloroflexi bacterium]|nr:winged helix-turn-helix domain-containing protein [Chloroflexota bacterium]
MPREEQGDDVSAAFSMLQGELAHYKKQLNEEGSRAFAQGYYMEARRLIDQAEQVNALINRIQALAEEWAKLQKERGILSAFSFTIKETDSLPHDIPSPPKAREFSPSRIPTPIPHGRRTPEEFFYRPILSVLVEMGGAGSVREVLNRVYEKVHNHLNDIDRARIPTGQIRWSNTAMWARKRMVEMGLLSNSSPRGIWEITPKGREYLARLRASEDAKPG